MVMEGGGPYFQDSERILILNFKNKNFDLGGVCFLT